MLTPSKKENRIMEMLEKLNSQDGGLSGEQNTNQHKQSPMNSDLDHEEPPKNG